jgi:hypothetical protein
MFYAKSLPLYPIRKTSNSRTAMRRILASCGATTTKHCIVGVPARCAINESDSRFLGHGNGSANGRFQYQEMTMKKSARASATLIAAASATAVLGLAIPTAHADAPDQQFLNLVHSNGVGGQDDSLIAFAHEFCDTNGPYGTLFPLYGQGVSPGQVFIVKTAASRAYCPNKIVVPVVPPPVFHG